MRLTPDAARAWEAFTNAHAAEKNAEDFPDHLYGPWSKLKTCGARIALVLHYLRLAFGEAHGENVDGTSVEAAARVVDYFKAHTRKVMAQMGTDATLRRARKIVAWVVRKGLGAFSKRDAFTELRSKDSFQTVEDLDPALSLLEKHSLIRAEQSEESSGRGRKPSPAYEVNPKLLLHAAQNAHNSRNPPPGADGNGGEADSAHSANCARRAQHEEKQVEAPASPFRLKARGRTPTPFSLVRGEDELAVVRQAIEGSGRVGLDVETTGLDAGRDRVRLLSLSVETVDGGRHTYVIDCFGLDPSPLWESLAAAELVLHNAAFDLAFLARLGFTPGGAVHDTMLLAQLFTAGTRDRVTLAACCERHLGLTLDKAAQKSDWSGVLSEEQLAYAAADVAVLIPLWEALEQKVQGAGLQRVAEIERRCLPAVVWMGQRGVPFDAEAWQTLARGATQEADRLRAELSAEGPARPGALSFERWNWDSPAQAREALALAGCVVESTDDRHLAAAEHPLADLLRRHREARKRVSTYGEGWLKHVAADGRIYPGWRQIGAASGRMSCSGPNMQQLPRGEHRRCVVAGSGRVLVKADYSQIELRIAARVSGDESLLGAYRRGEDLHALTARSVLGIEEVSKENRQLAKALNFGLLYGMGARGFRQYARTQYGQELSEAEARRYRGEFFRSYPGLAAWHRRVGRSGDRAAETRTLGGRCRSGVQRFTEKLSSPMQGTGADGLKLALALLWERREQVPGAFPVLAVHDEIVVECDAGQAEAVGGWLRQAMVDAMAPLIEPVPVEVAVKVARTWGGD